LTALSGCLPSMKQSVRGASDMPNSEWSRLTPTQAAAVERCIAKARKEPGRQTEDTSDGEAYAYQSAHGSMHWGFNGEPAGQNTARGVVAR